MILVLVLAALLGVSVALNVALAAKCFFVSRTNEGLEFVLDGLGADAKARKEVVASMRKEAVRLAGMGKPFHGDAAAVLSKAIEIENGGRA